MYFKLGSHLELSGSLRFRLTYGRSTEPALSTQPPHLSAPLTSPAPPGASLAEVAIVGCTPTCSSPTSPFKAQAEHTGGKVFPQEDGPCTRLEAGAGHLGKERHVSDP